MRSRVLIVLGGLRRRGHRRLMAQRRRDPEALGPHSVLIGRLVGLRIAGSGTAELDAATGGYGLNTASVANSVVKWAFGYPAEGKYKGKDLIYCSGPTSDDPYGAPTWGIACTMNGGSSGGPWIYGTTNPAVYTSGTLLTSVNSYSYSGLQYMFGPRFNTQTQTVFTSATSGTASPGTSVVCSVGTSQPNC